MSPVSPSPAQTNNPFGGHARQFAGMSSEFIPGLVPCQLESCSKRLRQGCAGEGGARQRPELAGGGWVGCPPPAAPHSPLPMAHCPPEPLRNDLSVPEPLCPQQCWKTCPPLLPSIAPTPPPPPVHLPAAAGRFWACRRWGFGCSGGAGICRAAGAFPLPKSLCRAGTAAHPVPERLALM